jgi:hypothetical protein
MTLISTWAPQRSEIASITTANPGVVTTTSPHGYLTGLYVRLVFPDTFGMPEVAGQVFLIDVLSPTTFSIDQNTSKYTPFALGSSLQVPQVSPVAEVAFSLSQAEHNTLNVTPGYP